MVVSIYSHMCLCKAFQCMYKCLKHNLEQINIKCNIKQVLTTIHRKYNKRLSFHFVLSMRSDFLSTYLGKDLRGCFDSFMERFGRSETTFPMADVECVCKTLQTLGRMSEAWWPKAKLFVERCTNFKALLHFPAPQKGYKLLIRNIVQVFILGFLHFE